MLCAKQRVQARHVGMAKDGMFAGTIQAVFLMCSSQATAHAQSLHAFSALNFVHHWQCLEADVCCERPSCVGS
jgi:hypothetical protein